LLVLVGNPQETAMAQQAQQAGVAITADGCSSCHGPDGKSTGAIPSIDQLDAATISAKLKGFKSGEISSTVMNRFVKAFTDPELDALAQYIAAH
jgi:cytochrome c553